MVLRVLTVSGTSKLALIDAREIAKKGVNTEILVYRKELYAHVYDKLLQGMKVRYFDQGLLSRVIYLFSWLTTILLPSGRGKESRIDILTILLIPLLHRKRYDTLIFYDQLAAISGLIAKKLRGIPYFTYAHEVIFTTVGIGLHPFTQRHKILGRIFYALVYYLESKILKESEAVFFNSKKTMRRFVYFFPSLREKGYVVYPGCKPTRELPEKEEGYVLAFSRWDAGRYPSLILRLAEESDAHFVIAGSWTPASLSRKFLRDIRERELAGKVRFLGEIEENQAVELYSGAGIFVQWAWEGFSMGVLEAMAHGAVAIVSRFAGASEIIADTVDGFIARGSPRLTESVWGTVSPNDLMNPSEYVKIINTLLANKFLLKRMSRMAWEKSKQYSWERRAECLITCIKRHIAERGASS